MQNVALLERKGQQNRKEQIFSQWESDSTFITFINDVDLIIQKKVDCMDAFQNIVLWWDCSE